MGEGFIEKGFLWCFWYGWDYYLLMGCLLGGFDDVVDIFLVEIWKDGVYIGVFVELLYEIMIIDVMVEMMVNWGVEVGFGMVGYLNFGLVDVICR